MLTRGRPTSLTRYEAPRRQPGSTATTYSYDALGQITSTTQDATGGLAVKHEYGYDATFVNAHEI